MTSDKPILSVEGLTVTLQQHGRAVKIVDGVGFGLRAGETLAVVGESGCGKSMTALGLMRLAPSNATLGGRVMLNGTDLLDLSEKQMRGARGKSIAMVSQDPFTALNPVMKVGDQIADVIVTHEGTLWSEARRRAVELMDHVRIPEPERRSHDYPFAFSGGMRQRIAIAIAIAGRPSVLIADEPTTALDVTVQAQILKLLINLQRESGMALILISHDLGIVSETADRIMVMYAGRHVEEMAASDLVSSPLHPYTKALLRSRPIIGQHMRELDEIPGIVAAPSLHVGCAFAPRCASVFENCYRINPELRPIGTSQVACLRVK